MEGYAYNERLSKLKWKGCKNLWAHGGLSLERQCPPGFVTMGVPGVLKSTSLRNRDAPMPSSTELDDLVRGLVDDQGEQEEYHPLYIIDHAQIDGHDGIDAYRVGFNKESVWTVNYKAYGWISFRFLVDLIEWINSN